MQIEVDVYEVVAEMMKASPTSNRRVWEFYIAMKALHPEFMHVMEHTIDHMNYIAQHQTFLNRELNHAD